MFLFLYILANELGAWSRDSRVNDSSEQSRINNWYVIYLHMSIGPAVDTHDEFINHCLIKSVKIY